MILIRLKNMIILKNKIIKFCKKGKNSVYHAVSFGFDYYQNFLDNSIKFRIWLNDDFVSDKIWFESLKAAKDFDIPIVLVDCQKCLLSNIEKIEKNLELFESRYDDSKVLKNIIESIYTINCGYKDVAAELLEKQFDKYKLSSYLGRVINHIDEISINAPRTSV